jgi:hypothetical protein
MTAKYVGVIITYSRTFVAVMYRVQTHPRSSSGNQSGFRNMSTDLSLMTPSAMNVLTPKLYDVLFMSTQLMLYAASQSQLEMKSSYHMGNSFGTRLLTPETLAKALDWIMWTQHKEDFAISMLALTLTKKRKT